MKNTMTVTAVFLASATLAGFPMRGGMVGLAAGSADSLRKVQEAYVVAMRAGDAEGVAAVFGDDATEMPPGVAPVRGKAAIEEYYRSLFGACRFTTFELTETESRISGDVGYVAGVSRVSIAGRPEESGKYLVVLKRAGDGWKVAYAIHNDDASPPAGPPGR
jgi:uncharacterized protein (TIGR02246 family)